MYLQRVINFFIKILSAASLTFAVSLSTFVNAAAIFEPHITEGQNNPVCGVALNYYSKAYHSKAASLEPLSGDNIVRPSFSVLESFGDEGAIIKADISVGGQAHVLLYSRRMHSWRGDNFEGYLISPEQVSGLVDQIKQGKETSIKPFYGTAWRQETPFQMNGDWYMDETMPAFDENNGDRNIFRLLGGGTIEKVCQIKIFESFDAKKVTHSSELPFFSAYVRSMEEIMLSDGSCGTSHPEVGAQESGRYFVSQSVMRPWALNFEPGKFDPPKKLLNEHFDQWRYSDIWSYRERDVLENLKLDAQSELSLYLQKNFSYSLESANTLASQILDEMKISYYSLASFDDAGKDFSKYQQLIDGNLAGWQQFANSMEFSEESMLFPEFSLVVDNPHLIEKLPQSGKAENYVTIYGKDLLMAAAHMNNYDAVRYLVEHGWALDRATYKEDGMCWEGPSRVNRSALTYAVENASPYLISYLIRSGANAEVVDSDKNNLNFYLQKNPRFSDQQKSLGLSGVLALYPADVKIKPSFSCDGKLGRVEASICKSEGLSIYDLELRDAFTKARSISNLSDLIKNSQIKWLINRNKLCGAFIEDFQLNACIARITRARIRYLENIASSF